MVDEMLQRPYSAFLQSGDREQAASDDRGEELGRYTTMAEIVGASFGVSRPATDFIEAFGEPVPRAC